MNSVLQPRDADKRAEVSAGRWKAHASRVGTDQWVIPSISSFRSLAPAVTISSVAVLAVVKSTYAECSHAHRDRGLHARVQYLQSSMHRPSRISGPESDCWPGLARRV